jgi:hypothetical protein
LIDLGIFARGKSSQFLLCMTLSERFSTFRVGRRSLNADLLEQNSGDAVGRDLRRATLVSSSAQAVEAGGADIRISRPQFAQIGRNASITRGISGWICGTRLASRQFRHDLDLRILGAVAAWHSTG